MSKPPKNPLKSPKFISIEGNIGSGKSTILKIIRQKFPQITIFDEPLGEWQKLGQHGEINLLELYYKDPIRYGFTFQIFALMSRIKKWSQFNNNLEGGNIRISQRSLLSDKFIFARLMHDMQLLDEAEHGIYLQLYEYFVKMCEIVELYGIIFICCKPQNCYERVLKRSREGQNNISKDYLEKIHEKHEEWLSDVKNDNKNSKVLLLDNNYMINTIEIVEQIQNWIISFQ